MRTSFGTSIADAWASRPLLGGLALVAAGLIAYANSLSVPLVFDDLETIQSNPNLRQYWSPAHALTAPVRSVGHAVPSRSPLTNRPVVSLSLAINYALGGTDVRGYHVFNLAVHLLTGFVLFDVVRRTLQSPRLAARFGESATALATAITAVWLVHPLQTEAVTYITQRTELLMGLFYLLTLAGAIRAWDRGRETTWSVASILCCSLGMLSKEVMVSAPLMVALWDWTMRLESPAELLARRWKLYAGLAATWTILGISLWVAPFQAGIGFGQAGSVWDYARTQVVIVARYLGLALWPSGLCLDHGTSPGVPAGALLPAALLIGGLLAGTAWALWRRAPVGFPGAWFFLILAPTSSVLPITLEPMAERRMYLPLAAVVSLGVLAGYRLVAARLRTRRARPVAVALGVVVVAGLALLTARRNADYASVLTIWRDTVAKAPDNARAHLNLGMALTNEGRQEEALAEFGEAVRLKPGYAEALNNLGVGLVRAGRMDDGVARIREAIATRPDYPPSHYNLAAALRSAGKADEAIAAYEEAIRLKPDFVSARINLGSLLSERGRLDEAIEHYRAALRVRPDVPEVHYNLGNALSDRGDLQGALAEYQEALRLRPEFSEARANLDATQAALAERPRHTP